MANTLNPQFDRKFSRVPGKIEGDKRTRGYRLTNGRHQTKAVGQERRRGLTRVESARVRGFTKKSSSAGKETRCMFYLGIMVTGNNVLGQKSNAGGMTTPSTLSMILLIPHHNISLKSPCR